MKPGNLVGIAFVVLVVLLISWAAFSDSAERRQAYAASLAACQARMSIARTSLDSLYALSSEEPSKRGRQCQWVLEREP